MLFMTLSYFMTFYDFVIFYDFVNKSPSSQGYGFSSSHVWMWELDHKEGWAMKNWCFFNCAVEEDSWESLGLQGDQTSQS